MSSTPNGPRGIVYRLDEALVPNGGPPHPGIDIFVPLVSTFTPNLGVISMESPDQTIKDLARAGLSEWFKVVRSRQSTEPEIDLYRAIALDLGVRPDSSIAIDTSPEGIYAAKQLGYYSIGLVIDKFKVRPGELIEAGAHCVAADHLRVSEYIGDVLGMKPLTEESRIEEAKKGGALC